MSFLLTSTTEEQQALEKAAGPGWKTPPDAAEKPPDPGDVPKEIPQKIFNQLRDEQIAAKKKAGPDLFLGEEHAQDVESPIKKYEVAKQRDRKAEEHKRELRSILDRVSGERFSDEPQSTESPQPSAERNGNAAPSDDYGRHYKATAATYGDFDEAVAAADRSGVRLSNKLEAAIRAIGNPSEIAHIAYGLAKNPGLVAELGNDPAQLAQISPTIRHASLLNDHQQRMRAADKADVAAVAAANVPIAPAVLMAVLEQSNSDSLAIHLARNPDDLEALNQLPASAAMARVGRLAERLEAKAASKREARTRVPAPISPVGGSSTRSGGSLEEMPIRDFIRTRNKQEFERKRFGGR